MKPGEPLKRTPMPPRKTPLTANTSGLRRTSIRQQQAGRESLDARKSASKGKTRREVGPSAEVVDGALEREHFSCALCGMGIGPEGRGVGWSVHHRLRRSQGVDHSIQNVIILCGSGTTQCHGWVHANPADARAGGWLLSGRQEPLAVPVLVAGQRWVYLTSTGFYHDVREAS